MESKMYISESEGSSPKFASTNSIPALVDGYVNDRSPGSRKSSIMLSPSAGVILRDSKGRRHSVLDELKARRDSFFQKARRSSIFGSSNNSASEDKENTRRSSDSTTPNRRGSKTPRSKHEEDDQPLASLEQQQRQQSSAKKGRRKSWNPLMVGKSSKLDRKRRKGVASGSASSPVGGGVGGDELGSEEILYSRQKRPSWWNIFVPDSVTRYIF
ncbi:hypothetical protein QAD02_015569 [Eretmocerus hayati]|uniref:Uncharacterized protein n=1 Tax=Eretmocerus hayati TaxID=131215 RepID=A0ACC2PBF0_9HYME|nr:hypothetical protein QAD02_015569 [Eretmocerus hayati]